MGFFDADGKSTQEWKLFQENFPGIGVFKLSHNSDAANVDYNTARILNLGEDCTSLPKEGLYELLDKLNENAIEGYKGIFSYKVEGESRYINLKIAYEQDYLLGFVQDVTDIMHSNVSRDSEQECDLLTGIPTRKTFIKQVRHAISDITGVAQCCMAVLHINGIEKADSELNYEKTALCITAASSAIKRFQSESVLIGFKSYKDYFLFFKQTGKQEVSETLRKMGEAVKACKIMDEFGNEIQTRSGSYSITCGYCWYPSQAATIDMMINYADFALFRAISSGSKEREFSPDEYVNEQNSYADSSQLAHILDGNLFEYCFQPIVSALDGSIYAYEALMRPSGSNPLELLRMARDHGRLYDVELATFENVLAIANTLPEEFKDKKIFINSIPDFMLKAQDFYRLQEKYPHLIPKLVIELTEQSDLTDDRIQKLRRIYCDNGCMIAIDDYGSGYSNTAAMLTLSPDVIKIDRSLITDINKSTRKQHFLSGIVDFARMNGIRVLAEGVETYDEMNTVIRRGVDFIQGFYTARPFTNVVTAIANDIVGAIKAINLSKPDIKAAKIYDLKDIVTEPIKLAKIAEEHFTTINISCGYVNLEGDPDESVSLNLMIAENKNVHLVLKNVCLNGGVRPCITVGENSRVRLEIIGRNSLLYDGIIVPDSADLTIEGQGDLYIDSYRNNGCCIGSSYSDSFGRVVIDIDGTLEMTANGDHAVCMGGGMTSRKNALSIVRGVVKASVTGVDCIGIGVYNGKCGIFVGNCKLDICTSGDNTAGIGSIHGVTEVTASKCSMRISTLGKNVCGIGNLAASARSNQIINLSKVEADITTKAQRGACIGFLTAESNILISKSDLKLYFEGDTLAGIGSIEGNGTVEIDNTVIDVQSKAGPKSLHIGIADGVPGIHNTTINGVNF